MMTKIIINIFVALIELIVIFIILNKIKGDEKRRMYIIVISTIIYLIFSVVITLCSFEAITIIPINMSILLLCTYTYNIKFIKRGMTVGIFTVFSIAVEMIIIAVVTSVAQISPLEFQQNIELYLLCAIISKFLLFSIGKVITTFAILGSVNIEKKYGYLNLFMLSSTLILLVLLGYVVLEANNTFEKLLILWASVLLIFSNIISFIIYEIIAKNSDKMQQQNMEILVLSKQKEEYSLLISNQLKSNKEIHDIKHKMFSIKDHLENNTEKAIEIVNNLCNLFEDREIKEYTQIKDVDALLNAKLHYARINGVDVKYNIKISQQVKIDSMDICIVIGNILDNAIENSSTNNKGKNIVILEINTVQNYFAIKSQNTTANCKVKENVSTKIDCYNMHGYGLSKIKEISEKYDGDMEFKIEKGLFRINVILKQCRFRQ